MLSQGIEWLAKHSSPTPCLEQVQLQGKCALDFINLATDLVRSKIDEKLVALYSQLTANDSHPLSPSEYIVSFNGTLQSVAEMIVRAKYLKMDFPAPEFAATCPGTLLTSHLDLSLTGLPPLHWNNREYWEWIVATLERVSLPPLMDFDADDIASWPASRVTYLLVCYAQKLQDGMDSLFFPLLTS